MPSPWHPVDALIDEHQAQLAVADALEAEARSLLRGAPLRAELWGEVIRFAREVADASHQQKEERVLFAALADAGLPRRPGPLAVLEADHRDCRELVEAMATALESSNGPGLGRLARSYARCVRDHVAREDRVVFEMARQMLTGPRADRLAFELSRFDERLGGAPARAAAEQLARHICSECGIDFERRREPPVEDRSLL